MKTRLIPWPQRPLHFDQIPVATVQQITGAMTLPVPDQSTLVPEQLLPTKGKPLTGHATSQSVSEVAAFPCNCPGCETTAGFPFRARTDAANPEQVHVDLRCRHCNKEWHVVRLVSVVVTSSSTGTGSPANTEARRAVAIT